MKYLITPQNKIRAFDEDGSQDKLITEDMKPIASLPEQPWTIDYEAGTVTTRQPETEESLSQLQQVRDQSLQSMTHELANEAVVQVRPQDIINFQTAIQLGSDSEWVLADNTIRTLTVAEMQECLQAGMQQGKAIWDNYIASLKALSNP